MKKITEAPISDGVKTFVRCDLDVPLENGTILEPYRLEASLETLRYIIKKGGFPVIAGHVGKPEGTVREELSTKVFIPYFDDKLGKGSYELLENLRFSPGEEQNLESFARDISGSCQIYINECFSTSHRKHASVVGIPLFLPGYAGLRLMEEVENLSRLLHSPEKPFVVIVGGAKLESKKPTIGKFLNTADHVLVGGKIGLEWKEEVPYNLHLASDYAEENLDIGPITADTFTQIIKTAKTILWAGPVGKYETEKFNAGTKRIIEAIAEATSEGAYSVIGGGDTITAVNKLGYLDKVSFVSTGGGAMLEYLVEGTLPGIEAVS